jgi:hypothetical protein
MANERKAVRIEYEYDDGTIERAVGDHAESIRKTIDGQFVFGHIHGARYLGPTLKPVVARASQVIGTATVVKVGGGPMHLIMLGDHPFADYLDGLHVGDQFHEGDKVEIVIEEVKE